MMISSIIMSVFLIFVTGVICCIKEIRGACIASGFLGLIFLFCFVVFHYDTAYKQGQIDAANGIQKYHLTTQPDNTSKWEMKSNFPKK